VVLAITMPPCAVAVPAAQNNKAAASSARRVQCVR
jgi:hypothetical protein